MTLPRLLHWRDLWSRADTHYMIFHHRHPRRPRLRHRYRTAQRNIARYALHGPGGVKVESEK